MFYRNAVLVVSALTLGFAAVQAAEAASSTHVSATKTKATHKTTHVVHYRRGGRVSRTALIPPPPAYMPSILPEIAAGHATATADDTEEAAKPENPYDKYVQTPGGAAHPQPLQTRKGVTYWAQRS